MPYKRLGRFLAFATASTLAIVVSGCTSNTHESASQGSSRLVTSGPRTGDLFVHGTIFRDGDPVRGARVVVELWPTRTKKDTPAMSWDTRPSTTDARGEWSISLDPAQVPSAYLSQSRGPLDFDLQVFDRTQFATWSATMFRIRPTDVWRTAQSETAASPVLGVDVDLARQRVALTDSLGQTVHAPIAVRRAS